MGFATQRSVGGGHSGPRGILRSRYAGAGVSLLLVLALAGCGESKQAKAEKTVCAAKAEIQTKVDNLTTVSPSVATLPKIKEEATAIVDDLKKIKEAQPDLSPARKKQAEEATKTFEAEVRTTVEHISPSTSLSTVEKQLKTAISSLATGFKNAFAPLQCS